MTSLNKQILDLVRNSMKHLSAEEVFFLAKEKDIKVSLASVYRILGKLAAEGYIRQLSNPGNPDMFDKNLTPHGHLICSCCGSVEDIFVSSLQSDLEKLVEHPISSYQLTVSYVCPACFEKGSEPDVAF
ncbi:MAG: transcriptional repressor [Firmicutes bacterium]|nr:transcriptional repressor [Bacillota bacterium]